METSQECRRPYFRNLVKNPAAKEGMWHWSVVEEGGDGFRIERNPAFCHRVEQYAPRKDLEGFTEPVSCWSTSYQWCEKEQLIDLVNEGCEEVYLDKNPPKVTISEWYAARGDCKVTHELKVNFLGRDKRTINTFKEQNKLLAGKEWFKVEHSQVLPAGTRYIFYSHKGKDEQYWAGYYGAKMTLSSVILTPPEGDLNSKELVGNAQLDTDGEVKCETLEILSEYQEIHNDFKKKYFNYAYFRNLIRNPAAKDGMKHWSITNEEGDGFQIEKKPIGCHRLERYVPSEDREGIGETICCWATSYRWCRKEQLIDLIREGCEDDDLDKTSLGVNISEWFSSRFEAKVIYKLTVKFLDIEKNVLDEYHKTERQKAGGGWVKVEHSQLLPPGTRYILYAHQGKDDDEGKEGHYGAKMTLSSVILTFPKKGMWHWTVTEEGGDGFRVERKPLNCHRLEEYVPRKDLEGFTDSVGCWSTSYEWCEKEQLIDLREEGFEGYDIDNNPPNVNISEWYAARGDSKVIYKLKVKFLDKDRSIIDIYKKQNRLPKGREWFKVEHYQILPAGTRYILYSHKGKDRQNWMGHYGAKMTLSSVILTPPEGDLNSREVFGNTDLQTDGEVTCEKEEAYPKQQNICSGFKKNYFNHAYFRNLIKNPAAKDGMKHWSVINEEGDGFNIEKTPISCQRLEKYVPSEDREGIGEPVGCWSTSYRWCRKEQLIDLIREGCQEDDLDKTSLGVNISEWFSSRFESKVIHKLIVKFLDMEKNVLDEFSNTERQPAGGGWSRVEHSQLLPPGTRYILYTHQGKDDEEGKAGHYGAKITLSTVILTFPKSFSGLLF